MQAVLCSWGVTVLQADSTPTSPPDAAAPRYSAAQHCLASEQELLLVVVVSVLVVVVSVQLL